MPNTILRQSVIQQLRERIDNDFKDAEDLVNLLTEMNTISEIDERNKSIHVDTEELEKLLNEAIIEDPSYKELKELEQLRYLVPRDHYKRRDKAHDIAIEEEYMQKKTEVDFRRCIRTSKMGFLALYEEIKDDKAFSKSTSGPQPRSVKFQMIVAFIRLGIYGNAATDKILGDFFSISQCIGFMDDSLFQIHQTPSWNPELFWCRKNKPAVQSMVICDFDTRILFASTGHYGSQNDTGVLSESGLLEQLATFFEGEQYVVADSAYGKTQWCVPIGKNSEHEPLTGSDIKFNNLLSRSRVSIENCFGALKGRFESLDELRDQLKEEADIDGYNRWVVTCFILHNFCLKHDDPSYVAEIIDYFYRTHDKNDYFETSRNEFNRASRNSKYGNYNTIKHPFVVPNISTSAGIEK
ncbi:uncharacterized protein ATC70_005979 [Mucor velutinosus]|uniref:DDE Tnp4 domain-containing protein n=1 Tax=Mucor velutinosus TaxID=708070 RepID=A0AAN7DBT4_9FUNG|nr:hypothetical protein ATC70_005979 [Mucor velutinosus]